MATCIEITIEDDGTFSVETEEKAAEEQENEPTEEGQKFKTADEALAAVKQMIDAASIAAPQEGSEAPVGEEGSGQAMATTEEEDAMNGAFRPGVTGR